MGLKARMESWRKLLKGNRVWIVESAEAAAASHTSPFEVEKPKLNNHGLSQNGCWLFWFQAPKWEPTLITEPKEDKEEGKSYNWLNWLIFLMGEPSVETRSFPYQTLKKRIKINNLPRYEIPKSNLRIFFSCLPKWWKFSYEPLHF